MNRVLVAMVIAAHAIAAEPAKVYRGKKMSLDQVNGDVSKVLTQIATVAGRSVVVLSPPRGPITLHVKDQPWDKVLDDAVAQVGLVAHREGSLILVGTTGAIEAHHGTKFIGKRLTVELRDADAQTAVAALSAAAGLPAPAVSGGRTLSLAIKNAPVDQELDLVLAVSGAHRVDAGALAPPSSGCAAATTELADLRVTGVVVGSATPTAVLADTHGHSWVSQLQGCVGKEGAVTKHVLRGGVVLGFDKLEVRLEIEPGSLALKEVADETIDATEMIRAIDATQLELTAAERSGLAEKRFLLALGRDLFDSPNFVQPIEADPRARLLEWPQTYAETLQLQVEMVPDLTANRQLAKRTLATVDRAGWHRTGFLLTWLCAQAADRAALLVALTNEVETGIRVLNSEKSQGVDPELVESTAYLLKLAASHGLTESELGPLRRRFDAALKRFRATQAPPAK